MSAERAVVDSSGWIEVFTNGPLAQRFLDVLDAEASLVVPSISILEVFKWVLREHSEAQAIQAAAVMQRGLVVDLDSRLAMASAQLSHTRCDCPWPTASSWPLPELIRPGCTQWTPTSRTSTTWSWLTPNERTSTHSWRPCEQTLRPIRESIHMTFQPAVRHGEDGK